MTKIVKMIKMLFFLNVAIILCGVSLYAWRYDVQGLALLGDLKIVRPELKPN